MNYQERSFRYCKITKFWIKDGKKRFYTVQGGKEDAGYEWESIKNWIDSGHIAGLKCGHGNFGVVDIENTPHKQRIVLAVSKVTKSTVVKTYSGGFHVYYKFDKQLSIQKGEQDNKLLWEVFSNKSKFVPLP